MNDSRINLIRQAYNKLDKNGDGSVKLDDIALLYDVSKHPDVVNLKKNPLEVYKDFMK